MNPPIEIAATPGENYSFPFPITPRLFSNFGREITLRRMGR